MDESWQGYKRERERSLKELLTVTSSSVKKEGEILKLEEVSRIEELVVAMRSISGFEEPIKYRSFSE